MLLNYFMIINCKTEFYNLCLKNEKSDLLIPHSLSVRELTFNFVFFTIFLCIFLKNGLREGRTFGTQWRMEHFIRRFNNTFLYIF